MKLYFWKKDVVAETIEHENGMPDTNQIGVSESVVYADPPEDNVYAKISRFALYTVVTLLPLFFLTISTNVLDINKSMLLLVTVGVALVSWLLGIVSSGWLSWRRNFMDYAIAAFLVATALATIFSVNPFVSIFGTNIAISTALFTIISLSIYYLLVVNNFRDQGHTFRSLFGVSLVLALLLGLLQVLNIHIFPFGFSDTRTFNTVGSINTLGLLAAIALPFLNRLSVNLRWINKLHLDKVGIILSLTLLLIIGWYVLWVVAIAGMVGMIVFDSMRREKFKVSKIILPMTVIVLGVFMMIVKFDFGGIRGQLPVEVAPRFSMSQNIATSVLKKSPLFGNGPENFVLAFDRYGASQISNTSLSNARFFDGNSEFVNVVVQTGVVGFVALAFLLWAVIRMIIKFKNYCTQYSGSEFLKEDVGVFASMVAALVGFFFYPFNLTMMFILFTLFAISVVIAWSKDIGYYNIENSTSLSLVSSLAFIGGLILVLVGGYFGSTFYLSDVKYAKALVTEDTQASAALLVEAINLNGRDDRYYRTASQVALALLTSELNGAPQGPENERNQRIQNYVSSAVTLAQRATQINPENTLNWSNLGNVYQNLLAVVNSADRLSEEAYLVASELRPGDANFYNRIGMLYLEKYELLRRLAPNVRGADLQNLVNQANEALAKAEENFTKAIEIAPNFGVAIYNLGAVYDRENKVNEAVRELEKIIPANPNQPGLNFELGLLYYRANRKADALAQLEQAILVSTDYSNARWYAALIYEEGGNYEKAIEHLEHILSLEINKDNQTLIDKLAQLKAGLPAEPPVDVINQQPLE